MLCLLEYKVRNFFKSTIWKMGDHLVTAHGVTSVLRRYFTEVEDVNME